MYCPNCEFEIKQDVTECPICGGALTVHPEEIPDAQQPEQEPGDTEQPTDLNITNLILDAKQELDSFEDIPDILPSFEEPAPEELDFESLLSRETSLNSLTDIEDLPDEPSIFKPLPDAQQPQEHSLLSDDAPARHDTAYTLPETDADYSDEPYHGETADQGRQFFADTNGFDDAPPAALDAHDSALFIDEISGKKLTSALNSMTVPAPQPESVDRQMLLDLNESASEPANSIDPFADAQQPPDTSCDNFLKLMDTGEPILPLDLADAALEKKRRGSSLRVMVLILVAAALAAGGAYVFTPYFLQEPEIQSRIQKPIAPAMPTTQSEAPPAQQITPTVITQQAPAAADPQADSVRKQPRTAVLPKPERTPTETTVQQSSTELNVTLQAQKPSEKPGEASPTTGKEQTQTATPFSVHVFSFKTRQAARTEIRRLSELNFEAYLETVDLETKGIWHRVKVGPYATRSAAEQARQDIKQHYPDIEPLLHINR